MIFRKRHNDNNNDSNNKEEQEVTQENMYVLMNLYGDNENNIELLII
jgi:hypothetical protein